MKPVIVPDNCLGSVEIDSRRFKKNKGIRTNFK